MTMRKAAAIARDVIALRGAAKKLARAQAAAVTARRDARTLEAALADVGKATLDRSAGDIVVAARRAVARDIRIAWHPVRGLSEADIARAAMDVLARAAIRAHDRAERLARDAAVQRQVLAGAGLDFMGTNPVAAAAYAAALTEAGIDAAAGSADEFVDRFAAWLLGRGIAPSTASENNHAD